MPLAEYSNRYPRLVKYLCDARLRDKLTHSWIFTGDSETSLKSFAYAWLQLSVCKQLTGSGDACGVCGKCQQLSSGVYPYLYEIKPSSKLREILIGEIHELEHFLFLKTGNDKKIGIIIEADRMHGLVQNAFLKTLEEPSPNTLLILITNNTDALLPTIVSRCQIVSLFNNNFQYDFTGKNLLCEALSPMAGGAGAKTAISSADKILELLKNQHLEADKNEQVKDKEDELAKYRDNKELHKKMKSQVEALKSANYIVLRNITISAIHTWFAQIFFEARGIKPNKIPNPELYRHVSENGQNIEKKNKSALRDLIIAEKLVNDLKNYNVDEKLAIQNFCQSICQKA